MRGSTYRSSGPIRTVARITPTHVRILERMAEDEGVTVKDIILRALTEHLSSLRRYDDRSDKDVVRGEAEWAEWSSRESITVTIPPELASQMKQIGHVYGTRRGSRVTHGERVARAVDYFLLM